MITANTPLVTDCLASVKHRGNYSFFVDASSSTSGDRFGSEGAPDIYSDLRQRLAICFGDRAYGSRIVVASIPHRYDQNGELVVTFTATSITDLSQRLVGLSCNLPCDKLFGISNQLLSNVKILRAALQMFDPRFQSELMLPANPNCIAAGGEIYFKNGRPEYNPYP